MNDSIMHVVCPSCSSINRIPRTRPARQAKCGKCHQALFTGTPVSVDTAGFERHITGNDIPVVVDFWAPWCAPCRSMAPAIDRVASETEPKIRFLKVNIDAEQALAARYGIRGIPLLMLFSRCKPIARSAGAKDALGLRLWLRIHVPEIQAEAGEQAEETQG